MALQIVTRSILKLPKRRRLAKKGDAGRVLIVAGSQDYPGAAALCAQSCLATLRSGCDWVTLAAPSKVAWAVNALTPDIVTKKLQGTRFTLAHAKTVLSLAEKHDVLCIGPGIGQNSDAFIRKIVESMSKPLVIDADAIKAVDIKKVDNAIFTPHQAEWTALLGKRTMTQAQGLLRHNVILLKGAADHIITKSRIAKNTTGSPIMAKAGTGDVLSGVCAGILAQMGDPFKSACAAAYLCGKVAELLEKKMGRTFIASDIVNNLHKVLL